LSTADGNTVMDLIAQAQPFAAMIKMFPPGRHVTVTVAATGVSLAPLF
jgi:hypothetical protein